MKFLVILVNLALTINAFADQNSEQESSGNLTPMIISGAATTASGAGTYAIVRHANNLERSITDNNNNIIGAQNHLPELENRVTALQSVSPEEIASRSFNVSEPLPANLGQAALHASYYQEYIDDPTLAKKANALLAQMNAYVAASNNSEDHLKRIDDIKYSLLASEYQAIIDEAQDKGLIKTRPAPLVRAQFEYMGDDAKTIDSLLQREEFKHRGFVDEAGHAVKGKTEFVLRLKKSYPIKLVRQLHSKALTEAIGRLNTQVVSIHNFQQQNTKAERDLPRARKAGTIGKVTTAGGVLTTLGIGYLLSSSTSVDTQLLQDTNPSTILSQDPIPKISDARK